MYTYTRRARIILINIWGGGLIKKILTFTSIYYIPPFPPKTKLGIDQLHYNSIWRDA